MPKRTDISSVLIIGAGPIIIGQACEFDYSGAQACKALREEGYRVILVNSNPATIMTDPDMADATYIEPVNWRIVKQIIEKDEQEWHNLASLSEHANTKDELINELSSAGLIDSTNIDASIFGTGKFYKEKQEAKKENIYSDIDEMLSDTLKNEEHD